MFEPGDAILYMKVGTHAQENLADIINRKQEEIDSEGFAMWGYGGNTCHPTSMVQPFAKQHSGLDHSIVLAMQPMDSNHLADPIRAEEYSTDGKLWVPVPERISVRGSRYALCIEGLEQTEEEISLSATRVAIGNSRGRPGDKYVRGRVDKACLEITEPEAEEASPLVKIGLVARLVEPYAVFLRN